MYADFECHSCVAPFPNTAFKALRHWYSLGAEVLVFINGTAVQLHWDLALYLYISAFPLLDLLLCMQCMYFIQFPHHNLVFCSPSIKIHAKESLSKFLDCIILTKKTGTAFRLISTQVFNSTDPQTLQLSLHEHDDTTPPKICCHFTINILTSWIISRVGCIWKGDALISGGISEDFLGLQQILNQHLL